jgi:type IV secretion system protein TrbL
LANLLPRQSVSPSSAVLWWLLINGPAIGLAIIEGLRSLGAQASGLPNNLAPSGIVDIGFDIFRQAMKRFR